MAGSGDSFATAVGCSSILSGRSCLPTFAFGEDEGGGTLGTDTDTALTASRAGGLQEEQATDSIWGQEVKIGEGGGD